MSETKSTVDTLEDIAITGSESDPDQVPVAELLDEYTGQNGIEE